MSENVGQSATWADAVEKVLLGVRDGVLAPSALQDIIDSLRLHGVLPAHPTVTPDHDETFDPFEGVGPTVGYCSKCGEAREAFYTCRDGGKTIPEEATDA